MPVKAASDSVGAQLAMMRKRETKTCQYAPCSDEFEGLSITKYCSDECRFKDAYLRRLERAAT